MCTVQVLASSCAVIVVVSRLWLYQPILLVNDPPVLLYNGQISLSNFTQLTTMSSPVSSDHQLSFCGAFKGLFCITSRGSNRQHPRPSTLLPILRVVARVSAAFTPLQSAAEGLLNVMETVEVRPVPDLRYLRGHPSLPGRKHLEILMISPSWERHSRSSWLHLKAL